MNSKRKKKKKGDISQSPKRKKKRIPPEYTRVLSSRPQSPATHSEGANATSSEVLLRSTAQVVLRAILSSTTRTRAKLCTFCAIPEANGRNNIFYKIKNVWRKEKKLIPAFPITHRLTTQIRRPEQSAKIKLRRWAHVNKRLWVKLKRERKKGPGRNEKFTTLKSLAHP